jgi:hypothetical protein
MNRRAFFRFGAPIVTAPLLLSRESSARTAQTATAPAADGWIPLFNGRNLDGWYTLSSDVGEGRGADARDGDR